jgi:hypothetical protein
VQSPSLNAVGFAKTVSCTAVAVLHGIEDAALEVSEHTLHLLLHPDAPRNVICACLRHLSRQLTAFGRQDDAAVSLFQSAISPLVQLVRVFCCPTDDVTFKPGRCVCIRSGDEEVPAIVCKMIDNDRFICSISSPSDSPLPLALQFVTVPSQHLQFSSMSHDVWRELLFLVRACTVKKPSYMISSGIAEILFEDLNLGPGASDIETGLTEFREALGCASCVIPSDPNDPVDIAAGTDNNWPPILNNVIMALGIGKKKKTMSLETIFFHVLRGQRHFEAAIYNASNSALSQIKDILLFRSMCNNYSEHWDNAMYLNIV